MTNVWTASAKSVEIWGSPLALRLTGATGAFVLSGVAVNFISPLILTAALGTFTETGNAAILVYSGASTNFTATYISSGQF